MGEEKKKTAKEIIETYDGPPLRIMEVCGTHTHENFRLGIRKLLPEQVELIRQRAAELVAQGLDLFSYHPPFSKEWLCGKLFPLRSVDECLTFLREKACKKPLRSEQEWLYLVEEFIKKEKR